MKRILATVMAALMIGGYISIPFCAAAPREEVPQEESEEVIEITTSLVRYEAPMLEVPEIEEQEEEAEEHEPEREWHEIGECRITHYCACKRCTGKSPGDRGYGITRTGTYVQHGRTVAVDPEVIPLGSEVLINGVVYIAEDTGVRGNAVDIYLDDHQECLNAGVYKTTVAWREADIEENT